MLDMGTSTTAVKDFNTRLQTFYPCMGHLVCWIKATCVSDSHDAADAKARLPGQRPCSVKQPAEGVANAEENAVEDAVDEPVVPVDEPAMEEEPMDESVDPAPVAEGTTAQVALKPEAGSRRESVAEDAGAKSELDEEGEGYWHN